MGGIEGVGGYFQVALIWYYHNIFMRKGNVNDQDGDAGNMEI